MTTRLAWIEWYVDGEGNRRANYVLPSQELADQTLSDIYEIVRSISKIRPLIIYFNIFVSNYLDLEAAYKKIADDLQSDDFTQVEIMALERQSLLQQRVINFISSASMMVERSKSHIGRLFPEDDKSRIEQAEKMAYGEFASYKLCEGLRNYCHHRDLPVHAVPISGSSSAKGWRHVFEMELRGENLRGAKKKLRDVVANDYGGEVRLIPVLEEYFKVCCDLFLFFASPCFPALAKMIALRGAVLDQRPNGAENHEPVLWTGPLPEKDGSGTFTGSSLSLLEVEYWGERLEFAQEAAFGFLRKKA